MRTPLLRCLHFAFTISAFAAGLSGSPATAAPLDNVPLPDNAASPSDIYGDLFAAIELARVYPDSKTFADAIPKTSREKILNSWSGYKERDHSGLERFAAEHFSVANSPLTQAAAPEESAPLRDHIRALWSPLTRRTSDAPPGGSLIQLPAPYVVPGGRFRELYYWDSYFTMLGLRADRRADLVRSMVSDFGSLIDRFDHIPNGGRTYYLSRSQPPVFYLMLGLAGRGSKSVERTRLNWLKREYSWRMRGEETLDIGGASGHVVKLPDGSILNRYHDSRSTPRDESFAEDVEVARSASRDQATVYAELRAGAESGWDYSSRWLEDGRNLATIRTGAIAPVDLNSLLYGVEMAIVRRCTDLQRPRCAKAYGERAARRRAAIERWMWDDSAGLYRDVEWAGGKQTPSVSAATLYPLFTGVAASARAERVAALTRASLLAPGGLRTTTVHTGQQWDWPNGWAPLQWIAGSGLRSYGLVDLADEIARRWSATVERGYHKSGRLLEKYDVETMKPGGGGEYTLQDGFGWTNGVARALNP